MFSMSNSEAPVHESESKQISVMSTLPYSNKSLWPSESRITVIRLLTIGRPKLNVQYIWRACSAHYIPSSIRTTCVQLWWLTFAQITRRLRDKFSSSLRRFTCRMRWSQAAERADCRCLCRCLVVVVVVVVVVGCCRCRQIETGISYAVENILD